MTNEVVALLGSSSVAGKGQAFDLIGELRRRPHNAGWDFLNFGVGGDLAYNARQRVPQVVASHPDKIVVLIGSNDIIASVFENAWQIFRVAKRLPERPTPERFRANLPALTHELAERTRARIALVSLPEVGEDPHSAVPAQARLNALFAEYAQIIRAVAVAEHVTYLPLYERLHAEIEASPGQSFTQFRLLSFYADTARYFVLRQSADEIARRNGWKFHVDGVHLNSRGGRLAADVIDEFIRAN